MFKVSCLILIVLLVIALWMHDGYAQPMDEGNGRRYSQVSGLNPYSSSEVHLAAVSCALIDSEKTICGWSSINQAACVARGNFFLLTLSFPVLTAFIIRFSLYIPFILGCCWATPGSPGIPSCFNMRTDAPTRSPTIRPSRNPSYTRVPTMSLAPTTDSAATITSEESHHKKPAVEGKIVVAVVIVGLVLLFAALFLGVAMRRIYGKGSSQAIEEETEGDGMYKPQQLEEKKRVSSMKSGIFSSLSLPTPQTRMETGYEDDTDEESSVGLGKRATDTANTSRSHVSYCSAPQTPSMTMGYSNYPSSSSYSKHSPASPSLRPTTATHSQRALPLPPRDFGNDYHEYSGRNGVAEADDNFYSAQPPSWDEDESVECRRVVSP
jgi:hypothetical protein